MPLKTPVSISEHAREAMAQRAVTKDEVFQALLTPTKIYPDPTPGRTRYVKDDLVVVIAETQKCSVVVTVLYNQPDQREWDNIEARNRRIKYTNHKEKK